jgi:hypothetical protein
MLVEVDYSGERLDLDLPEDRLVRVWRGPEGLRPEPFGTAVQEALEHPLEYPALRLAVVPGDRVTIPVSASVPGLGTILETVAGVLSTAGVARDAIRVLAPEDPRRADPSAVPAGLELVVHDPDDRAALAYLATTAAGRRVYLNRLLTDADFVLPIGQLGFDDRLGYRGPWSAVFPDLSDVETRTAFRAAGSRAMPSPEAQRQALAESVEVGWLLGIQLQVGVWPGASGPGGILVGQDQAVRDAGRRVVDESWTVEAGSQADLVVAGLGAEGSAQGWGELSAGLAAAARLVRPGGKIAILSRVSGDPGPALRHLAEQAEHDLGAAALRGRENDPDVQAARHIAEALARADVYLLSSLDNDFLEDLGIIPLARPEEARRLALASASCTVVSRAELVRASIPGESE